ncbi:tRNA (adenosine(37)-N6)-threonylcarbamoyltransferase complex ATPase subunit type 1 TsaE [Salinicoccus sesuvii]|uniref:tRNA threonylcarbamoyladenosine biosynthesis protein TsaE n=1 Tax=Salinicoccus sesuvii TaxID=868281 RepID=A0ABV7N2F7_9STAP
MECSIQINNIEETERLADTIAQNIMPGSIILLSGDLGAGKTTFTQFLGSSLGVKRRMSSPTFNIIKTYQGKYTIHHMDCYRLEDSEEDLGFDEYFNDDDVSIVEWPQFIQEFLPEQRLEIHIAVVEQVRRVFTLSSLGPGYTKIMEALANDFPSN